MKYLYKKGNLSFFFFNSSSLKTTEEVLISIIVKEFLISNKLFVISAFSYQVCRPFGKVLWIGMKLKLKKDQLLALY